MSARKSKPKTPQKELQRLTEVLRRLDDDYPDPECALVHQNVFQLLAATILSAQCTDKRVNMVTPELFKRFPTPSAMGKADQSELEELIRSTGFYRNKAKNLKGAALKIVAEFKGRVPKNMEDLLSLPGVARKTANVVLGTAYGIAQGVVVDTHVKRLSRRLGLTQKNDPVGIEKDLMAQLPVNRWINFSHQLIHHGRQVCHARTPKCSACSLVDLCPFYSDSKI